MGAWGPGLLQNEAAQEGFKSVHEEIETDVTKLGRRRAAESMAGKLAAGVGLLLQLNDQQAFQTDSAFFTELQKTIERHEESFDSLPRRAATLLRELRANPDKGAELAARPGSLDRQLQTAFFGKGRGGANEWKFGKREPALFEHPDSAAYVQKMADHLLRLVSAGFRKRDQVREVYLEDAKRTELLRPDRNKKPKRTQERDLYREGGKTIAALAALLVIEPVQIDPLALRDVWDLYRAANAGMGDGEGADFARAYRASLHSAIEYGIRKFSGEEEPLSIEE
jgi:hypothetical protein